ncbi:MAG TPA: RNA ligase family protein [Candidatus Methylacidiphilales bacterium]|nr:RNA ligase family protein [Candidatus Methylacidiphilales bacterium]
MSNSVSSSDGVSPDPDLPTSVSGDSNHNSAGNIPATPKGKPLGGSAYGSIPHLPGSRRGPGDRGLSESQANILTLKARDRHDVIIVQEKLDGSCCSVARLADGEIVPLTRRGYVADTSPFQQHHAWHRWVLRHAARFEALLKPGERCVGEWLMEAHGTRYNLPHEPFVIFDIIANNKRLTVEEVTRRTQAPECSFTMPRLIHAGGPLSIEAVLSVLEPSGHGALDPVEGAVWRAERRGVVDFLGKYVIASKEDGKYLSEFSGNPSIYNWQEAVDPAVPETPGQ